MTKLHADSWEQYTEIAEAEIKRLRQDRGDCQMVMDGQQAELEMLRAALAVARNYLYGSLGNPGWTGPDPYPIIDAALGHQQKAGEK